AKLFDQLQNHEITRAQYDQKIKELGSTLRHDVEVEMADVPKPETKPEPATWGQIPGGPTTESYHIIKSDPGVRLVTPAASAVPLGDGRWRITLPANTE